MNLLRKRPLCTICAALLLSAPILLHLPLPALLSAAVAAAVLWALLRRRGILTALTFPLVFVLCVSILFTEWHPRAFLGRTEQGDILVLTVAELEDNGDCIGVSVERNGIPCPFSRVLLKTDEPLAVGDRVTLSVASLSVTRGRDANGIHSTIRADGKLSVEHRPYSPRAVLERIRSMLALRLDEIGTSRVSALLSALLLGDPDELSLTTSSAFRRLGLSHVLAISGMHLLVIARLLSRLLVLLGVPRRTRGLLSSFFLILYAAAVGFSPSILRALLMALVSEASFFVGRRTDALCSLFFSGGVLAVSVPRILLSLSFQLSFAATFGIISCAQVLRRLRLSERVAPMLYRFVVFPTATSLFALLFTLPLTLSGFGRLSLAALPANLLLAPLYELLLCVGLISLCIGPILPIKLLVTGLGGAVLSLTEWAGSLPLLLLDASHPTVLGLFTLLTLSVLLHLLRRRTTKRAVCLTVLPTLALLTLALALFCFPTRKTDALTVCTDAESGELLVLATGRDRAVIDLSRGDGKLLTALENRLSDDAVTELSLYLPAEYGEGTLSAVKHLASRYLLRLVVLPEAKDEAELTTKRELIDYLSREGIPYRPFPTGPLLLGDYRLTLQRSTPTVLRLEIRCGNASACYLSGAAAGLLHYAELPYSDHLILGSHGAAASRLPDTSRYAEHLVLCDEVYPEIYHSGPITRLSEALTLPLTE